MLIINIIFWTLAVIVGTNGVLVASEMDSIFPITLSTLVIVICQVGSLHAYLSSKDNKQC